jgi:hypothetical protein
VDWVYLAHDWYQWRALVIEVLNLSVPRKTENFLTNRASQKNILYRGVSSSAQTKSKGMSREQKNQGTRRVASRGRELSPLLLVTATK